MRPAATVAVGEGVAAAVETTAPLAVGVGTGAEDTGEHDASKTGTTISAFIYVLGRKPAG